MAHEPFSRPTRIARTGLISSSAVSILVSIYGVEYQGFENWEFHNAAPASLLPISVVLVTLYFLISFAIYCADDLKNAEDPAALARAKARKNENDRLLQEISHEIGVALKYFASQYSGKDIDIEEDIRETIKHMPGKVRRLAGIGELYLAETSDDVTLSVEKCDEEDRNLNELAIQASHIHSEEGQACFNVSTTSFVDLRGCFQQMEMILDAAKQDDFHPPVRAPRVTTIRTYAWDLALPALLFSVAATGWFGGLDWLAAFLPG